MTDKERSFMVHALGLTRRGRKGSKFGRRWAYRNYFCAADCDVPTWDSLVERGLAHLIGVPRDEMKYRTYAVSPLGILEIGAAQYVPAHYLEPQE